MQKRLFTVTVVFFNTLINCLGIVMGSSPAKCQLPNCQVYLSESRNIIVPILYSDTGATKKV